MDCKCKHCDTVLAIIILIFSFWQVAWASWLTSRWIIVVAAVLILLHGLGVCKCNSRGCRTSAMASKVPVKKAVKKKAKKKRR